MDWWSELWLNEGFATWVGWLAVDHFHPGKDFSTTFRLSDANIRQTGMFGLSLWYAMHEVF